jgi:hypothetical protein
MNKVCPRGRNLISKRAVAVNLQYRQAELNGDLGQEVVPMAFTEIASGAY